MVHKYPPIHFPAEFAQQALLLMTWPDELTDWQGSNLHAVQETYIQLINAASAFVQPWVICRQASLVHSIRHRLASNKFAVCFSNCDYDDTWIRDYGPITTKSGSVTILNDFQFNGWGQKYPAAKDNQVTKSLWNQEAFHTHYLPLLKTQVSDASLQHQSLDWILEGGSIDHNGSGTLITSEGCLLNRNRGSLNKQALTHKLKTKFDKQQIQWLSQGALQGDDTDGHIDTLVRFINSNTLVYQNCQRRSDPHFELLSAMKTEIESWRTTQGIPYQTLALPLPEPKYNQEGQRLPATYANFLMINQGVLLPTYNCKQDTEAIAILQAALPYHKIIPIDATPLIQQAGSIHCATIQLPF